MRAAFDNNKRPGERNEKSRIVRFLSYAGEPLMYIYREFGTKIQWEYDERRLKTSASNWKGGERGERAGRGGNCELLYERIL